MSEIDLIVWATKVPWWTVSLAFVAAIAAIVAFGPLAAQGGWIDRPNHRKTHEGEVPLIGGWGILAAMLCLQLAGPAAAIAPAGYWVGALLLFLVAAADDRYPIRARYRFAVQSVAALAGVAIGGQVLPSLGDLLRIGPLTEWWIVWPVSLVGTLALINALNFTDGADGLCGGLGLIGLFWLLVASVAASSNARSAGVQVTGLAPVLIPLTATVIGGLAGFLLFNLRTPWRRRASVFLGDSGSTLVGFTLAWCAIHVTSAFGNMSVSPVACLWITAVPLADSASCIARRIQARVTPMTPDLKHLHHLLIRLGLPVSKAVAAIHAASFACGLVGVGGWWLGMPEYGMLAAFAVALLAFVGLTIRAWGRIEQTRQSDIETPGAVGAN